MNSTKIVVTKLNIDGMKPATFWGRYDSNKASRIELFYDEEQYVLGNIYVAHVNDLVKNINAAFVEYSPGCMGYLSLDEAKTVFFSNKKNTTKICEGDNILVQIKKEPIKTKDAVVSTNIEYSGKYIVLTYGKPGISVSSKITDKITKENLKKIAETFIATIDYDKSKYPLLTEEYFLSILNSTGIIFRTECSNINNDSVILQELCELYADYLAIFYKALTSKGRTLIKCAEDPVITLTKRAYTDNTEVITDDSNFYDNLKANNIDSRLYLDNLLPLYKLYSIESVLDEITSKKIWLKSGGYLVIEYTEAMTVIDVNSGKCVQGKDKEKTIEKINNEAADEILRQLSIRNISGIIIVDFIDMKSDESRYALMQHLRDNAKKDEIRTSVVDMTKLGLVELTRKKIREKIIIKKK